MKAISVGFAVVIAIAAGLWKARQSSPLGSHSSAPGYAAAFDILAVDAADRPMPFPTARLTLAPNAAAVSLEDLLTMENVILFALDLELRLFVFVEVDNLTATWAEPFLDRAIPKHAGKRAWSVPLEDVEGWLASQASKPTFWVWNSGRCGSTLMHRVVSTVGVASVSESCWMDQLAQARGKLPDDVLVRFLKTSYALDVKVAGRLFPEATIFSMNPKAFGYRILDLVEKTYPAHKMMYIYRSVDEVAQSFWRMLSPGLPPPVKFLLGSTLGGSVLKMLDPPLPFMSKELQMLQSSGGLSHVSHHIADKFTRTVLDGLAYWVETDSEARHSFVLRFKELNNLALREKIVVAALAWVLGETPSDDQVSSALLAFKKDSQEGSSMSKAGRKLAADDSLSPTIIAEIRAASERVPSAGRADFVAPKSLFVELAKSD